MDECKEYCETNYYNTSSDTINIPTNQFWISYAEHIIKTKSMMGFVCTEEVTLPTSNIHEMLFAISIIDLTHTEDAIQHKYTSKKSRGMEIEAGSNLIMLIKEIQEAEYVKQKNDEVLVVHRFYEEARAHEVEEQGPVEEFLVNEPYVCELIITNMSARKKEF